jgi:hypothetical protein
MMPKLILDEQTNRLHLFINPFLENMGQIQQEKIEDFALFLPKNRKSGNFDRSGQVPEIPAEILSQSEKKVCIATEWRGVPPLLELFSVQPIILDFVRFYAIPLFRNKIFIRQKYIVEKLSSQQIADEIDCSRMAVLDALVKFGIPVREQHYHHGRPSQPRYGKKYQKKIPVNHQIEQRLIEVVSQLRKNKLTLRQIAQVLNDMKVPTKCQGVAWHQEMIRRILNFSVQ